MSFEKVKGNLEAQISDLQVRLVQAETNSHKSSRREVEGLENRVSNCLIVEKAKFLKLIYAKY